MISEQVKAEDSRIIVISELCPVSQVQVKMKV